MIMDLLRGKRRASIATGVAVVAILAAGCTGTDDDDRSADWSKVCEDATTWESLSIGSAEITEATGIWNDGTSTRVTPPEATDVDADPFCEVAVTLTHGEEGGYGPDEVGIWVWLPEDWNGRLQAIGGGGTYATNGPEAMREALAGGYAVAASDAGIGEERQPNIFLTDQETFDWQIFENWTHRSVGETGLLAQATVEAFYDEPAAYSYWNGCSNGGRQGLAAAQRYPDLFDGVLAAAPTLYGADRLNMTMSWPAIVQQERLGGLMEECTATAMTTAIIDHCDADDGAQDGLLSDPRACDVAAALQPLIGTETPCGSIGPEEVAVALEVFAGPTTADGQQVWYGFEPGIDLAGGAVLTPPAFALQNFAFADLDHDWTTVGTTDLVTSVRARLQGRLELLATADPSLTRLRDAGGKVLMWHGLADAVFPAQQSVHYVDEVTRLSGEGTADFLRLFLAAGVDHCGGGTGPAPADPLAVLVDWVEEGTAPETLLAEQRDEDGEVIRTRELCAYPAQQTYSGGDVDDAGSFACEVASG